MSLQIKKVQRLHFVGKQSSGDWWQRCWSERDSWKCKETWSSNGIRLRINVFLYNFQLLSSNLFFPLSAHDWCFNKKFHSSLTSLIQNLHESLLMPFHKMKKVPSHMQSSDESCVISICELKFTFHYTIENSICQIEILLNFGKRVSSKIFYLCKQVNSH